MDITPELIKDADEVFEKFVAFLASLTPSATDGESGTFYHIVTALSSATQKNYVVLRRAFETEDDAMLAWSCRNLLELFAFTKFALGSKVNALEFAGHRLIDIEEIAKKLKQLELQIDSSLTSSTLDPLLAQVAAQMAAEEVSGSRFLSARDLISRLPKTDELSIDEFDIVNKLCSKFVHPTVWSLLTSNEAAERFPLAFELFYGLGAKYMLAIYVKVREHIREHGLYHRPTDL